MLKAIDSISVPIAFADGAVVEASSSGGATPEDGSGKQSAAAKEDDPDGDHGDHGVTKDQVGDLTSKSSKLGDADDPEVAQPEKWEDECNKYANHPRSLEAILRIAEEKVLCCAAFIGFDNRLNVIVTTSRHMVTNAFAFCRSES